MPHLKQIGDHRCGPRCACRQVSADQPRPEILPADTTDRRSEVATLAHDFGNLLQVAASALGQIERSFDPARDAALCALSQAGTAALVRAGVLSRALLGQRPGTAPEPILPAQALAAIAPLLALAAGRQFAERNGGWVEIDSTPGKGTAITIGLPGAAVAYPHSNGDQG
ncbi:hypothetical protein [Sphingomonas kyeonggiensis]|uniref:Uncharacterized protein n=1 Tax=Sphingomonas kyeonggiensis TaxID=1268553 RepID=A0A7W6JRK1_9SPHN|nr:hypothetical protein [Sphingomonas kyeonggiensis]MBB4098262.1 hypothetical protein [Sphingomonas kyeonggiensis]